MKSRKVRFWLYAPAHEGRWGWCCGSKQYGGLFLENGFNYFDTAHGYLGGKSETALKECLTSRYSRDRYILTDK